ncbi:MAG: hypothetical protein ACPLZG_10980, partial [Thermoproteota archaeon]
MSAIERLMIAALYKKFTTKKKPLLVPGIPFPENPIWGAANHAILVGGNGSGKTYLLHYLVYKMATDEKYTSKKLGWNMNSTRTILYIADFKWEAFDLLTLLDEKNFVFHLPEGVRLVIRKDSKKLPPDIVDDIKEISDILDSITKYHRSVEEFINNLEDKKINIIGDDAFLREISADSSLSSVQSAFLWKTFQELVMKTRVLELSPATFFFDEGGNYLPAHGKGYRKGIERQSSSISNLLRKSRSAFMNNVFSALSYNDIYSDIR